MQIVDANVILRFLLGDNPALSKKAGEIIRGHEVFLPFEVLAEVVYVLEKVYQVQRPEIKRNIEALVNTPSIETTDYEAITKALDIYGKAKLDFVDSILCGYAIARNYHIHTFDKKLGKVVRQGKEGLQSRD